MAKAGLHLTVACRVCGEKFRQSRSDHIYCSGKCASRAWAEVNYGYTVIPCQRCKTDFKRLHSRQKYCSKACGIEAQSQKKKVVNGVGKGWSKNRSFVDKSPNYKCLCCGGMFYTHVCPSRKHDSGKFCSNKCRTKAIAMNPKMYPQMKNKRSKIGKRPDLNNQFFRSAWEANYARYLNLLIKWKQISSWEFEPDTFEFEGIKRGSRFYTPDFKIFKDDGSFEYHEIKGYMDARSATKLKRMKKFYPSVGVILIDKKGYAAIAKSISRSIPEWEGNYGCK